MSKRKINMKSYKGCMFKHFKGNIYIILDVAYDTSSEQHVIVYRSLYGTKHKTFTRPYTEFMSEVDKSKYPNVTQKYRFEFCQDQELTLWQKVKIKMSKLRNRDTFEF